MGRIWVLVCLLAAVNFNARANQLTLAHGSQLIVNFSVANYGYNNPGVSPYPTYLQFELAGFAPAGSKLTSIPGSSEQYYSGIQLQGWIQSLDGTASAALVDNNSWRLGLQASNLVAVSQYNGSALVDASVSLKLNLSQAIFGPTLQAQFVIRNSGSDLTIGLGPGYSLSNAVSEPMVTGAGYTDTAGTTQALAVISAPEPGMWALFSALLVPAGLALRRRERRET